ncbi:nitrogen permease regulator 2 [Lojkania enalia]|uniref:Nitrogen permease regulator 2 n=1 Tax=Lojkania enalia TaxID=147567 RepID=A0A9P4KFS8_9PLEO|nr:nitrogen permease regulator 2 [Didymosphaeria enalia]
MPTRAIKAIFFTRFHHEKGPRVLHQAPEGSITPSSSPSALSQPLLSFDSITTYLIPTQQFCDRLLTFCTNHYRVIGYPVCIREGKYSRNEFIFNFALVVEEGVVDWVAYGEVVRKLGRLLRALEEQAGFLSREEVGIWEDDNVLDGGNGCTAGGSKVYALCEMVLEDLNNYAECMIPIDDSNTINLKLFPTHPPPTPIQLYHVPLLTISLTSLTAPISSDLTLTRIIPFINGINSVSHISQLADTDHSLTRKAIQHLVYYNCVVLLDIFSFGAIYAPTAEIGGFITDTNVQEECARYVLTSRIRIGSGILKISSETERREDRLSQSSDVSERSDISTLPASEFIDPPSAKRPSSSPSPQLSPETLITLYTSLRQGLTLKSWVLDNLKLLDGIDVRRFITFGIIKGFLYRVHKYAISTSGIHIATSTSKFLQQQNVQRDSNASTIRGDHNPSVAKAPNHNPSLASTQSHLPDILVQQESRLESLVSEREALPLVRFLDGMHCFDEICTELGLSERSVESKIRGAGEVQILYR